MTFAIKNTEHRPKNKCELNPNEEGCVCDEYETIDYYELIVTYWVTDTKPHLQNKSFEVADGDSFTTIAVPLYYQYPDDAEYNKGAWDLDSVIVGGNWLNKTKEGNCIKAHEPNECEKGNENYVLDCTGVGYMATCNGTCTYVESWIQFCYRDIETGEKYNCSEQKPEDYKPLICRPKVLSDYSCEALGNAVSSGYSYCPHRNKINAEVCNRLKSEMLEPGDIFDVMKEKGCLRK